MKQIAKEQRCQFCGGAGIIELDEETKEETTCEECGGEGVIEND